MRLRPWIIGTTFGGLGLLALPLTGALPHAVGGGGALVEGYRWLAVRQSVTLRSLFLIPPADLDEEARHARAAGHYEMVCRACHGAPGHPAEAFAQNLSPRPPPLAGAEHWRPAARVFVSLRDGIAHSAMPAWPSPERADEIWDMVAFLERLPEVTVQDYQTLTGERGCGSCHDRPIPGIPRLDLQTPSYLAAQLTAYRDGGRASGTMKAAAQGLTDDEIATLAGRYGKAVTTEKRADPPPRSPQSGDIQQPTAKKNPSERGARNWSSPTPSIETLLIKGDPSRDIPACFSCHSDAARTDLPRLIGQDQTFLHRQLSLFAELGTARGGPRAAVMAPIAKALSPDERAALAQYLSTQSPSEKETQPP